MPQMSPLNWLVLFFLFSLIFIYLNIYNYYNIELKSSNKNKISYKKSLNNWKW